tara:strand:- start:448 stop:837 length:390 start_codon:yes stop_codon:yes gene_type:complete
MTAGWKNPDAPYDFTQGEWEDYKKNYSNLSWEEYKQMKEWNVEERMGNKKYSFTESYNKPIKEATDPVHYQFDIEPFDYIHDNQMGFAEGNVIKYITRWRYKENGIQDLYKAKQYIDMLIAKELVDDNS